MDIEGWIYDPRDGAIEVRDYCTLRHLPSGGGHLRVALVDLAAGSAGPVLRHSLSAELVHVVEGSIAVFLEGQISLACEGSVIFVPPGAAHGFKPLRGNAQLLVVHTPEIPPGSDHERVATDFDPEFSDHLPLK